VSFDDQIHVALESLREHLEAQLRAFSQQAIRAAAEERQHAVRAATDAARTEVRSQAEGIVAEIRSQAEAQVLHIRTAAQKHADEVKRAAEAQIAELRKALEELRVHAQQQLESAQRTAQAEIERAHAERDDARTGVEAATAEITKVRADLATARSEADKAHAEVKTARTETEAARVYGQAARAEARNARTDAEAARREAEAARGDAESARAEAQTAHAEAQAARAEAQDARAEAQNARADAEAARVEIEAVRTEAHNARVEADVARAEAETARAEARSTRAEAEAARLAADVRIQEKTTEAVEQAHADAHNSELSRATRLTEAIRTLDAARGISEVLDRLVQCAGHEVDRAAMLVVKGKRLAGWRLAGFETDAPTAKSIDLSVEEAELAGVVLQTGVAASRLSDEGDGPALPPFAGTAIGRRAMAVPVLVGGQIVAVLYADARCADSPTAEQRWPATLEVLVRHGSRVLEAITVLQAAGLSLPEPMARGSHTAAPAAVERA
jgi:hypothetical protein